MKKLLVSDYDNTFYLNEKDIINNISKVNNFRKDSNIFIIATGRSFMDIMIDIKKFNIKYDYLIINHGGTILNNNNEIISKYTIDKDIQDTLIDKLDLKDSNTTFCCSILESRVSPFHSNLTKIHKSFNTLNKAIEINNEINNLYNNKINSYLIEPHNAIEIISSKVNKSKAIKKISDIENIQLNSIFTIGDSYNDIEMIKNYNGACMKNSIEDLKKIAISEYNTVSDFLSVIMTEKIDR